MARRRSRLLALLLLLLHASATTGLRPRERRQGYQITPKACTVNRTHGVCMFVWECIRHEGEHLGMCMDAFMFGSCCLLPSNVTVPTVAADTSPQPSSAVSTFVSQQQLTATRPPHINSIYGKPSGSKRPQYPNRYSTTTPRSSTLPYSKVSSTTEQYEQQTSASEPLSSKVPASTEKYSSPAENRVPSTTTSLWSASTEEPAFVTRPKPTSGFWSTSMRPRPPDLVPGSINGQRPYYQTKPPTSTNIKKPLRPTTTNDFVIMTTTKHPENKPGEFVTIKYPTKPTSTSSKPPPPTFSTSNRPTSAVTPEYTVVSTIVPPRPTERPAILDFVSLPPKPSTVVHLIQHTTTSVTTIPTTPSTVATKPPPPTTVHQQIASSNTVQSTFKPFTQDPGIIQGKKECGVPPLFPRPEMRIVGGSPSTFGRWPWQASVRRTSFFGFSSTHRCGGALLNDQWVATAGHCVDDLLTSQIRIRVGEYDFSSAGEPLPHEERGVMKKVVHPRYNFFTYEYDLALVQLDKTLEFAPHVVPICLPGSDDSLVGETGTVTGWGRLSEGGTLPSILQQVSVPIVSNEKCQSMFLRAGRNEHIPDIFLCAGYENGGRDSCQGDSGGPLQVRGKDGRYFLAGIISWGIGCAESNLPGVCTRISKFVPWIMENVT